MLDATVFNVLITNTDAHAKNYSILIGGRGLSLAPLYDLMVADAWSGLTRNMAQDIGGQRRGEHVQARHWERMARESGFSPKLLLKRVASLAVKVEANIPAALEHAGRRPFYAGPLCRCRPQARENCIGQPRQARSRAKTRC